MDMPIYTRQGDGGFTSGADGTPRRKDDPVCEALGAVDELNAHIGLCAQRARTDGADALGEVLQTVQNDLFAVGAVLADPDHADQRAALLRPSAVTDLEHRIDELWNALPPLTAFILPGGCELACRLHVARTVSRRAERRIVALADVQPRVCPTVVQYVNRLSDLLFAAARSANAHAKRQDTPWSHPRP